MNIVELLRRPFTDCEKHIVDVANRILEIFIGYCSCRDFIYVRFHTYPSNDPNGFRVIYVENRGYTLVNGDGDRGEGWGINGVSIFECITRVFLKIF